MGAAHLHALKVVLVMELQRERFARCRCDEASNGEEEVCKEEPPDDGMHSQESWWPDLLPCCFVPSVCLVRPAAGSVGDQKPHSKPHRAADCVRSLIVQSKRQEHSLHSTEQQ